MHVIRHGDGLEGMLALERGSVSLIVNDPPWGATKAPWDRPLKWEQWWEAIDHALAPDGILAVFSSVRLACAIVPLALRPFMYDLIWRKNRASGHLNANRAPLRAHETILLFGNDWRYTPQYTYGHKPMNAAIRISKSELYGRETETESNAGQTHRYQRSVLEFDSVSNDTEARIHPSQKPVELLRWLIRAYSAEGELVVDPTCGSGSLIHAARLERRRAIGWEIDPRHAQAAQAWLAGTDSPLFRGAGGTT